MAGENVRWRGPDGKIQQFLNTSRPAIHTRLPSNAPRATQGRDVSSLEHRRSQPRATRSAPLNTHTGQKVETTPNPSADKQINKTKVHAYSGVVFGHKEERNRDHPITWTDLGHTASRAQKAHRISFQNRQTQRPQVD